MAVAIRGDRGDWGGAQPSDVEAVARSAAASFEVFDDSESVTVVLQPTASEDDLPWTLSTANPSGEFVVLLNVRGNLWARLAYQFAHEFCHVLADPRTWTGPDDRFAWIEEALCEAASLFALRSMARTWAVEPPYPIWRDYSSALAAYEAEHISDPAHSLPPGMPFSTWLSLRLPLLEADSGRRDNNTVVAKKLLPVFETHRDAWRAVRYLHTQQTSPAVSLADFMDRWATACTADHRRVVKQIAVLLGVGG